MIFFNIEIAPFRISVLFLFLYFHKFTTREDPRKEKTNNGFEKKYKKLKKTLDYLLILCFSISMDFY